MGPSILETPSHMISPDLMGKGVQTPCCSCSCLNSPMLRMRSPGQRGRGRRTGGTGQPLEVVGDRGAWRGQCSGKSVLLPPPQAQAGPETSQETQSQQQGSQLTPNPTPSALDTSPRRPPGPTTSPTSPSLSSPGKGRPGPGVA